MSAGLRAFARHRRLLGRTGVKPLLAGTFLGVLPIGMNVLALLLFIHSSTGSFAAAGLTSSAYSIAQAVGVPLQGYLADRLGASPVVIGFAALYALAAAAMLTLGLAGGPLAALVAAGALLGFSLPQLMMILAARWPTILADDPELQPTGYSFDSSLGELAYIGGPLLVGALAALGHPGAAIALTTLLVAVGAAGFATSRHVRSAPGDPHRDQVPFHAIGSPGLRTLVAVAILFGFAVGCLEVVMAAFATAQGAPGFSGVLLAAWALASFVAGLAFGALVPLSRLRETYLLLALALPFALAVPLAASSLGSMVVLAAIAGLVLGPIFPAALSLVRHVAPGPDLTQTFAWQYTALIFGVSAGIAAAGVIVEAEGWRLGAAAAVGAGVLTALVAAVRRSSLIGEPLGEPAP